MSRPRTFTREEIFGAAMATAETGLPSRLTLDGCILIGDRLAPHFRQYPTVPFPDRCDQSYVYFLQTGCFIKIGTAVDIRRRHSDIQGNNPKPVRLIHYYHGSAVEERAMHARFSAFREGREWFTLAGDLLDYLDEATGWA